MDVYNRYPTIFILYQWMNFFSVSIVVLFCFNASAQVSFNHQNIIGVWKVESSKGVPLYAVEIVNEKDRYFGKVVEVFNDKGNSMLTCVKCQGDLKDAPLVGLEVLSDMVEGRVKYANGRFLNFLNGDSSPCTIWMVNESIIKVRSWWLFFYRTYSWYRIS